MLPNECKVGEIYCLLKDNDKKEYYVCLEDNKLQRIIIESDLQYFEEKFGFNQNNETTETSFEAIINLLSGLNVEFGQRLNDVQETLTNTITKEELNQYERKIEYLSGLIFNYFL